MEKKNTLTGYSKQNGQPWKHMYKQHYMTEQIVFIYLGI